MLKSLNVSLIGLIEWPSDTGETPCVLVAHTHDSLDWMFVTALRAALGDDPDTDDDFGAFVHANPWPEEDSTGPEVLAWLTAMRREQISTCCTVFEFGDDAQPFAIDRY